MSSRGRKPRISFRRGTCRVKRKVRLADGGTVRLDSSRGSNQVCSYDKCVAYCTRIAGKHCSTYCERRLQDKRRDKICK